MVMLSAGVLLWALVHFIPGRGRSLRQKIVSTIGEKPYKGIFSLCLVAALGLIVFGWRSAVPQTVYLPPSWGGAAAIVLMPLAIYLFGASNARTRVKRLIRHPQLTGIVTWSCAHLLANGDSRSLLLFGGMGLWALLEIVIINRRDRDWIPPQAPPLLAEIRLIAISLVVFLALLFLHPYFAGVAALRN
ncbi:MAG: NnrU family protein [Gammaproteobacteria bacterium]|nr:NnrU family protein [Gammaproteobacteria bacterium]MDH4315229.1 NnrU family protein [Gammaproteobacteria bacterium]MDH5215009.1 NnrU family protein [Gammaproteobacteria bacterium]MDH5501133.1 NnrU family protein [Gammaproteobacteria bacterium]